MIALLTGFLIIFISYSKPYKAGWFYLALLPFGSGMSSLILIPDNLIYINFDRMGIFIAIGIVLKKYYTIKFGLIMRGAFYKALLLFISILTLTSLRDLPLSHVILNKTFYLIVPIVIAYYIISNIDDFKKLLKYYAILGGFLALSITLEFLFNYSPTEVLYRSINNITVGNIFINEQSYTVTRAGGFLRVSGFTGNSIFSGIFIAFILPFAFFYSRNNKLLGTLTAAIILIALFFIQTKSTILSTGLAILLLTIFGYYSRNISIVIVIGFFLSVLLALIPSLWSLIVAFTNEELVGYFDYFVNYGIRDAQRYRSIPAAISLILENPFLGYGSTTFVYSHLLQTDDLPSFLLYFLSGGFLLGITFLYIVFKLIIDPLLMFKKSSDREVKAIYLVCSASALAALFPLATTHYEAIFPVLFVVYTAFFKLSRGMLMANKSKLYYNKYSGKILRPYSTIIRKMSAL